MQCVSYSGLHSQTYGPGYNTAQLFVAPGCMPTCSEPVHVLLVEGYTTIVVARGDLFNILFPDLETDK